MTASLPSRPVVKWVDEPTCGQPTYHHDLFYCGPGCPWWPNDDDESENP